MPRWALTGLAALCAWQLCGLAIAEEAAAAAQPEAAADGGVEVSDEAAEAPAADAGDTPVDAAAQTASFIESARELQEKFGQLKALLDKRGDAVDPGLKEKLKGLEDQLTSLGLGPANDATSPEVVEFLGACIAMSMRRAGGRRPATLSALRRLGTDKFTRQEASKNDFVRLIVVCINELSDQELSAHKTGDLATLPKALADKAALPEAETQVLNLDEQLWKDLRTVAAGLSSQLGGTDTGLPVLQGVLAAIPLVAVIGFLGKKFLDMQKREEEKRLKAATKKEKEKQDKQS